MFRNLAVLCIIMHNVHADDESWKRSSTSSLQSVMKGFRSSKTYKQLPTTEEKQSIMQDVGA
jgi:hypothetical protein